MMGGPIKRDAIAVSDLTGADWHKIHTTQSIGRLPEEAGEKTDIKFFRMVVKLIGQTSCHYAINKVFKAARFVRADK